MRPAGFIAGAIGGSTHKIFRYAFLEIMWGFLISPGLLLQPEMFEAWRSFMSGLFSRYNNASQPAHGNKAFVKATLDSIAVSSSARGINIGRCLVYTFERAVQEQGASVLGLGVGQGNTAARRLYESCRWVMVRENKKANSANYYKELTKA